jgi:aspartyl-tRNA(Asn)/glutamyl-tRNA(Gln) amidotransferase subunit A
MAPQRGERTLGNRTLKPIAELAAALRDGRTTARKLVEQALANIDDPAGEGARAFIRVWRDEARAEADRLDACGAYRQSNSLLCGIPLSVKDLFDVAGEVTLAGSASRIGQKAADEDAIVVRRLRLAGAVLIGRANMTEFAFSGIGINRKFGTPLNPWDRDARRIPGGSSSGSAVSVADGMCAGAVASDTGGSIRAPAALCGLVGFKPSRNHVPLDGVFPRSYSLDTVGPIGRTVTCCAIMDAVLSAGAVATPGTLQGRRIGVVGGSTTDGLAPEVARTFEAALLKLEQAGAILVDTPIPELAEIQAVSAAGGISPPEAFSIHRHLITERPDGIDPIYLARLLKGGTMLAADYVDALRARADITRRVALNTDDLSALAMPTCPVVAPRLDEVSTAGEFEAMSKRVLQNCNLANFLDRAAITTPDHADGEPPTGLMLMACNEGDEALLSLAFAAEAALMHQRCLTRSDP